MIAVPKPANAAKRDMLRRLRYGHVIRIINDRYGPGPIPDDDAGRPDLMELLYLASMAESGAEKKCRNILELRAPWMSEDESERLIVHLTEHTAPYEKLKTARELGEKIHLMNADRERLRVWSIRPVDLTDAELREQSKARERARRASKRRAAGKVTWQEHLARLANKPKPWIAEGISQRQWQRRQACRDTSPDMSRYESETIVNRTDTVPRHSSKIGVSKGNQAKDATKQRETANENQAESPEQESLSVLRHSTATCPADDLKRVREARAATLHAQWINRNAPKEVG